MKVNKYPVYDIVLDISIEGQSVYEITRIQLGIPIILTKLIIGKEYNAFIDSSDKYKVQIPDLD